MLGSSFLAAWAFIPGTVHCSGTEDLPRIRVGNPVAPWPSSDSEGSIIVLDLGICFSISGIVQLVHTCVEDSMASTAWPTFLVLQDRGDWEWSVQGVSQAVLAQPGGASSTKLLLQNPLSVQPGNCLAWHIGSDVRAVAVPRFVSSSPPGVPGVIPHGDDKFTISAISRGLSLPPQVGERVAFREVQHRRYALQAELRPASGGFAALALGKLGHGPGHTASAGHAVRAEDCWSTGLSPETCCVPAGVGSPLCFDGQFTYKLCCSKASAGAAAYDPFLAKIDIGARSKMKPNLVDASGSPREVPTISVDLFVRTFHGKLQELMHLLQSVAIFWPPSWGVIVVLDGESALDEAACALLPQWATCSLQDKPRFFTELNNVYGSIDRHGQGLDRHRGLVWKEWSECWADRHSSADYIAIADSDVVFTTFGVPQLLFQPAADRDLDEVEPGDTTQRPRGLRPVIWAHADNVQFPGAVHSLQLPWQAEFMDSFPLVVRRQHFSELRQRIVDLYGNGNTTAGVDEQFDWAFATYVRAVQEYSMGTRGAHECPSFHSMMGSWLWTKHRDAYVWSIRHGHLTGVELRHTCPRLRVAQHVAYWGRENWMSYGGYPFKHLKVGGRPEILSEVAYAARATSLVLAGICVVPWKSNASGVPVTRMTTIRRALGFLSNHSGGFAPPDFGLVDVQRDLCSRGLGLVEGSATSEDRLLARCFPAQRWTAVEAQHCGSLRPARLLAEYRRLMSGYVFSPL